MGLFQNILSRTLKALYILQYDIFTILPNHWFKSCGSLKSLVNMKKALDFRAILYCS